MLGIVRGVWGDPLHVRHYIQPPLAYTQLLHEVKDSRERGDRTDRVYCFGRQNYEYVCWLGYDAVLLDKHAYGLRRTRNRGSYFSGMVVYGMNHFGHKWWAMDAAFQDFDSVLWVDWDLHQVGTIPENYEEQLQAGSAPFRATLAQQQNWTWGAFWRRSTRWPMEGVEIDKKDAVNSARIVTNCSSVWIRNRETVQELRALQEKHPVLMNQQLVSYLLDSRQGRWIGQEQYIAEEYHTIRCHVGSTQLLPVEDPIWKCHPPKRSRRR